MKKYLSLTTYFMTLSLAFALAARAQVPQGGPYTVNQSVIAGGGGQSGGGTLNASGTAGQPAAGPNSVGGQYKVGNGFWWGLDITLFTITTLNSSVTPSVYGQPVTLTATVVSLPAGPIPTGTISFFDNNSAIPACQNLTVSVAGQASCSLSTFSPGSHPITAGYTSNTVAFFDSIGGIQQLVNKANTSTALTSNANPAKLGQTVTFTAVVSPVPPGAGTLAGNVQFLDGANLIAGCGAQAVNGSGVAVCTTSSLAGGNHTITAVYSGDGNFNASTGNMVGNPLFVDVPPTAAATTTNITAAGGATYTFTVTYTDDVAINVVTLDNNDVRVTGPNGFNAQATFVSVNTNTNGTPRTATYTIGVPGGVWDITDNGTYSILMQGGQVADTIGNFVSVGGIGSFTVSICNSSVTTLADSGTGSLREAVAFACNGGTISFAVGLTGTITLTTGQIAIPTNLTIQGPGANVITVSGNNTSRVFSGNSGVSASINNLTITGGKADFGAGVFQLVGGTMNLRRNVISNNTATNSGGGVYNNAGTVNIVESTVSGNTATGTGGGVVNSGVLTLVNSTVSGNAAGSGGGINNLAGSTSLASVTVTNNTGGGVLNSSGTVTSQNTIIAANAGNTDVTGAFVSNGYNLIGNTGAATGFTAIGDQTGTAGSPINPQLAPLSLNAGTTPTHAFNSAVSPAIDKGKGFGLITDQRGAARASDFPGIAAAIGGDNSDIGAFESQFVPGAGFDGNINRSDPNTADSADGVVDLKDLQWFDNFINGTFIPAAGGAPVPLTVGPSSGENQKRDVAPVGTAGDGCINSLDRQQMVLFVLGLAQSGPAGGPSLLNQCPPPRPGQPADGSRQQQREAVVDTSINRSLRLVTSDEARGASSVQTVIEMDAVGNETQMMLTLEFDPNALAVDGTSFPGPNNDITLGEGSPAGTTVAVNASEAGAGRITIMLNFNGPIPSGAAKRIVTVQFRIVNGAVGRTSPVAISDAPGARQLVNGAGEALPATYSDHRK